MKIMNNFDNQKQDYFFIIFIFLYFLFYNNV